MNCNKHFITSPSSRIHKNIFCSKKCEADYRRGKKLPNRERKVTKICKACGKEYKVINYRNDRSKYCSLECRIKLQRGKNHPSWKGGIAPYYNNDEVWWDIRKKALIRDNYTCKICDAKRRLEVHHIIPYRLVGKHELENLVTLCEKCHNLFERNTMELLKGKIPGHPKFTKILLEIWMLHLRKNRQYASGINPLGNFDRCGAMTAKLFKPEINKSLAICLAYMSKQIDGVIEMVGESKKDCPDELKDKLMDIACYTIIAMILNEEFNEPQG